MGLGIKTALIESAKRVRTQVEDATGYDRRNWLRIRQIESWSDFLAEHGPGKDILEVSPGWNSMWAKVACKRYKSLQYPDFDISRDILDQRFDIVIADQVIEHVLDAQKAVENIRAMVKPGGYAMLAAPFLFRVHGRPHDYHRWTEPGFRHLLSSSGFPEKEIESFSWGNKACVKAHVGGKVRDYGYGRDLSNDEEYPVMVWAFARNA